MFVLDTNVVSELGRRRPDPRVRAWAGKRRAEGLFFSTIGEAELRYGVAIMPPGRRRDALAAEIERTLREDFAGRILPFDSAAARAFAEIAADRRSMGRPAARADNQIAAIARSRGMAVATRNIDDFAAAGIDLVNPWTAA